MHRHMLYIHSSQEFVLCVPCGLGQDYSIVLFKCTRVEMCTCILCGLSKCVIICALLMICRSENVFLSANRLINQTNTLLSTFKQAS